MNYIFSPFKEGMRNSLQLFIAIIVAVISTVIAFVNHRLDARPTAARNDANQQQSIGSG